HEGVGGVAQLVCGEAPEALTPLQMLLEPPMLGLQALEADGEGASGGVAPVMRWRSRCWLRRGRLGRRVVGRAEAAARGEPCVREPRGPAEAGPEARGVLRVGGDLGVP